MKTPCFFILSFLLLLGTTGCLSSKARIKGGTMAYQSGTGASFVANQSEDPKDKSNVNTETEKSSEIVVPAGSIIRMETPVVSRDLKSNRLVTNSSPMEILVSSNTFLRTVQKDKLQSVAGAAQKNTLGEVAAKLASMKWISMVGLAMILFGGASLFWAPLKAVIASTTTSLVIIGGGFLMLILPSLVVGNELLILAMIGGGVVLYFFTYRYAGKSIQAKIYKDFIDIDKDGLDDREERKKDPNHP